MDPMPERGVARRNATDVAPLAVACWYGNSVPCSISALVLSAVTIRGLETSRPLPSASSAESSRVRKRVADELKMDTPKVAAGLPLAPEDGRFTKGTLLVLRKPLESRCVVTAS